MYHGLITGSLITYPSKVDAFLGLMELDQNNKLDDFVISRYESFIVPNQKFKQTIDYINYITFSRIRNFQQKNFRIFKKIFSSNLAKLCSKKRFLKI